MYRRSGLVISREQGWRHDAGFAVPVLMSLGIAELDVYWFCREVHWPVYWPIGTILTYRHHAAHTTKTSARWLKLFSQTEVRTVTVQCLDVLCRNSIA